MSNQTTLPEALQALVREEAVRLFPQAHATMPGIVGLPCGIHPYNRNAAYYDPVANFIVLYQQLGHQTVGDRVQHELWSVRDMILPTIQHELCHWFQHVALGYAGDGRRCHRHSTWGDACFLASHQLWPEAALERWRFSPFTSRRDGQRIVKVQRPGALTDVELHHWPDSMPALLARLAA